MTVINSDCLEAMKKMENESIDSIVTDPPYGLGFMGKKWDACVPHDEIWKEALRIAKPGAFLLAFGGTRTYHRLTCAIEDAGWEIRDCIMWIYGSGFCKSHNFGCICRGSQHKKQFDRESGTISRQSDAQNRRMETCEKCGRLKNFKGWGTALKPAYESIIVAMKPCDGTFANNAIKHGLAGINIDSCRIATDDSLNRIGGIRQSKSVKIGQLDGKEINFIGNKLGRWPANLILDEEAAHMLDEQSGKSISKSGGFTFRKESTEQLKGLGRTNRTGHDDSGGASRFFKCIDNECFLCYNPCTNAKEKECNLIHAQSVKHSSINTNPTIENIAQKNAQMNLNEQFVLNVKSAENLCDSCAINIVRALVEIKTLDFKVEVLQVTLGYITNYKRCILIQNLVSFAELWENTDTIPTILSLSLLFGSVRHAIENSINQENHNLNGNSEQSRFLYCAKASSSERNGSTHPTVKPLKLMEYLLKLVVPKSGVVLDPFCGSGTTLVAARKLGIKAIGIEKEEEYCKIAQARVDNAKFELEQLLMSL